MSQQDVKPEIIDQDLGGFNRQDDDILATSPPLHFQKDDESWVGDGVPPVLDRSDYRRKESEAEDVWERRKPILVKGPEDWNRIKTELTWLGGQGIEPGIHEDPMTARYKDDPAMWVLGVNSVKVDQPDREVLFEVDHNRYIDPHTKERAKNTPLEYLLKFENVHNIELLDARSVYVAMTSKSYGLELQHYDDWWMEGSWDQYKCKVGWDERGLPNQEEGGWEIRCQYMDPEDFLLHVPERAKNYYLQEKGDQYTTYNKESREKVTGDQAVEGVLEKIKEWKRCPA